MNNRTYMLEVEATSKVCPIGQTIGRKNMKEGLIPVLSCEGACIRGEIARQAANMVAKEKDYARACHGEIFSVPGSEIANWVLTADKVVLIDGCFLHCHGRILKSLIGENRLIIFDALSHYKKYTDIFEIDDVPESERMDVARNVADWVTGSLET
jgi:uncharacterized metal-binding protein